MEEEQKVPRDEKGRFVKGYGGSPSTRFKKGECTSGIQVEGGRCSGVSKREQKTLNELCAIIGAMPLDNRTRENMRKQGYDDAFIEQAINDVGVVAAQYAKAKGGNTEAAKWIRDTKGESVNNIQLNDVPIQVIDLGL